MRKYYIELYNDDLCAAYNTPYLLQTKWFDTEKDAIHWYETNIDYVHIGLRVCLMTAIFDETEEIYDDIEFVRYLN